MSKIGQVIVQLVAGLAAGSFVDVDAMSRIAADLAFTMGVLAGSIFWSAMILVANVGTIHASATLSAVVRRHLRFSLRTAAFGIGGVVLSCVGLLSNWFSFFEPADRALVGVVLGTYALFLYRIFLVIGLFNELLDARIEAMRNPVEPAPTPRPALRLDDDCVIRDIPA